MRRVFAESVFHLNPTPIMVHSAENVLPATHRGLLCSLYRENKLRCSVTFFTSSKIQSHPLLTRDSMGCLFRIQGYYILRREVFSLHEVDTLNLRNPVCGVQICSSDSSQIIVTGPGTQRAPPVSPPQGRLSLRTSYCPRCVTVVHSWNKI